MRQLVKAVDVGQQRTAGGANAAVEVGTVPGRRAVQMLVGWMPTSFKVAVLLQLVSSRVEAGNKAAKLTPERATMLCNVIRYAVLYSVIVSLPLRLLTSFSRSTG